MLLPGDLDHESNTFPVKNALVALDEYASMHKNETRNRKILDMILLDGCLHTEVAQAVGCSAPVASHVVREAQRFVYEKLGYHMQNF